MNKTPYAKLAPISHRFLMPQKGPFLPLLSIHQST
jgi:hypothetical protein